jgi:hypothetical protein
VGGAGPDPVAITTWHQALGSTLAVEIPHDLFALWLYPASGGVVLLGPEALARDRIDVPLPDPLLRQDQLFALEEVLRRARYASAIAVPIRSNGRDVGLILVGSFERSAFGPGQVGKLQRQAAQLSGTLSELARKMPAVTPHAVVEPVMTVEELPGHLARAIVEAATGPDLVRRVSGVLYPLVPHDRVEILAVGKEGVLKPLSGNLPSPFASLAERFGDEPVMVIENAGDMPTVLGARLELAGLLVGYLLLGSVAEDAFRPEDEDVLAMSALLLAPRVHGLGLVAEMEGMKQTAGHRQQEAGT